MSETPNGLRGEMAAACFDPGAYVGPRGARTTDQWRADACIAGPLAPFLAQVSALQAEVERLQKGLNLAADEATSHRNAAVAALRERDAVLERLQKVEGEREKDAERVPSGPCWSDKPEPVPVSALRATITSRDEAAAAARRALTSRLQHRLDAMAEHGMDGVSISKGFASELIQALAYAEPDDAAYEQMEAISALVQQGWDADECVYDAARLRWLEEQARKSRTGISFDWIPTCEGEPSGFRFMRRFFVGEQCKTLRAAIDRAMADDPAHASDRPEAEIRRFVAALTGQGGALAPCDRSGAADETRRGSAEGESTVTGAARQAPSDNPLTETKEGSEHV